MLCSYIEPYSEGVSVQPCLNHWLTVRPILKAILSQFETKHCVKRSSDTAAKYNSRQTDNVDNESDIDEVEDDEDDLLDDKELIIL